ncbi:MAG: GntR family transcriptional regulator [Anaerolineales bacterium]
MIQSTVPSSLARSIRLDFRSDVPLYLQIVEQVRELIARQELRPGDQLPTVRALATELRINFNTVARAYRILDEAGLISTQQGRGTFVSEIPPPAEPPTRQEALRSLVERFVSQARALGVSNVELMQALEQALREENVSD